MRYEYVVSLKRENEKYINRFSLSLCVLSMLAFFYEQISIGTFNVFLSLAVGIMLIGIILQVTGLVKKKNFIFRNWLLLAGIFWIGMPYLQWLSIFFFILSFLEYQAKHPLEIGFSKESILINTLFRKKYSWSDFNNVILKDGLLTLDFRNNKLLQRETLDDDEPDADEDEFNAYCRAMLNNH
jgi:hypothetical protein